jgi:hypothetical protein
MFAVGNAVLGPYELREYGSFSLVSEVSRALAEVFPFMTW